MAVAGWCNELSSLICVDLSSGFKNDGVAEMGAIFVGFGWREHINFVLDFARRFKDGSRRGWVCRSLGGSLVIAGLIEMALFDHGNGVWRMLFKELGRYPERSAMRHDGKLQDRPVSQSQWQHRQIHKWQLLVSRLLGFRVPAYSFPAQSCCWILFSCPDNCLVVGDDDTLVVKGSYTTGIAQFAN